MGAEETPGVEPRLQLGQGAADGVRPLSHVDHHLLLLDADPIHLAHVEHADGIPVLHRQAGQVPPLGRQALQQGGEPGGQVLLLGQRFLGPPHRRLQARLAERLEQIVQGVDLKGPDGVLVVGRDKDDGRRVCQRLDDAKAVQARHLDVQQHQVGRQRLDRLHRLEPVDRFADHLHALQAAQHPPEPLPCRGLVVYDERAQGIHDPAPIGTRTFTRVPLGLLAVIASP